MLKALIKWHGIRRHRVSYAFRLAPEMAGHFRFKTVHVYLINEERSVKGFSPRGF